MLVAPGRPALALVALVLLVSLLRLAGGAAAAPATRAALETLVTEMLRDRGPVTSHGDTGPAAMLLYAHAFAGYGLVNAGQEDPGYAPRAAELLDPLIDHLLSPVLSAPFHAGNVKVAGHRLSASVAPRGHLGLLLVGRRSLGPLRPAHEAILRDLIGGLAADLRADPRHLLPTYGRRTWPADNEVAAAALALYLATVEQDPAVAAGLAALQGSLAKLEASGLPPSAVAGDRLAGADVPRGCALSWTVAMRGLYDPARAGLLYRRYREHFWVQLGPVCGFREWPRGVDRPADPDSGPILMGMGFAASGIGIGAALLAGAQDDHRALLASGALAGLSLVEGQERGRWLERAIALWARTARPWLTPGQGAGGPARPPAGR